MSEIRTIEIKEVKGLLENGKNIEVEGKDGIFYPIADYFEKGTLPTYEVITEDGNSIKTSAKHRFFTSQGWLETEKLKPDVTKIFRDDNKYYTVESVNYIGEYPIVDIEVNSKEHSYFGNGFLNHNSGKSLLASHVLAETQKKGGVGVMIDTEMSVSREFWEAIGVDVSKLLYVNADSVEQLFDYIETIIEKVRKKDSDKLVTIVVDSVAAASTKDEIDGDFDKDGYATGKAIIISKAMRKITNMIGRQKITLVFTNQLRQKMGVMFGDPWTTSGGKALAFHSSVRLRLKNMGKIKQGSGQNAKVVGMKARCQVIKNRMGPPMRSADFEIYFDRGIDDYGSWLSVMKENKIVKGGSGGWYTYERVDMETGEIGEEIKFQSKDFIEMMEEQDDLREEIYERICNATILEYKTNTRDIESMETDESDED